MTRPHPALLELAAGRALPLIDDLAVLQASAHEHRMMGLLWSRALAEELVASKEQLQNLAMYDLRSQAIDKRNWRALGDVIRILQDIDVEVATFKGVTAEARWYDRIGERPGSDVDLLVDPSSVGQAREIISALQPDHPLLHYVTELVGRGTIETVALRFGDSTIDVHFALLELGVPLLQRHTVWARTRFMERPDGGSVRVLDPETALIHFLLHLNKDRFSRLLWYADIVRLLQRETDFDWDYVDIFARVEGLEAPIYLSLDAVLSDLGIPIPDHPEPTGWKPIVWRRLWSADTRLLGKQGIQSRIHRQRVLALMFEGRKRQALHWWLRKLFPPDPILAPTYPNARGPYGVRVVTSRFVGAWRAVRASLQRRRAKQLRR